MGGRGGGELGGRINAESVYLMHQSDAHALVNSS